MTNELRNRIFDIAKQVSGIDFKEIDPNKNIQDQTNLDSMGFVSIIARLEKQLNIEIPIQAMRVDTLNDFLSLVEKQIKDVSISK